MKRTEEVESVMKAMEIAVATSQNLAQKLQAPGCDKPPCHTEPEEPPTDPKKPKVPEILQFYQDMIQQVVIRANLAHQFALRSETLSRSVVDISSNELRAFTSHLLDAGNRVKEERYFLPKPIDTNKLRGVDLLMIGAELQRVSESLCAFNALIPVFSKAANDLIVAGIERIKSAASEGCNNS